jgi:hypothetical protein
MATKKFTDFELRTPQTLNPNDFIVGYKSDASTEVRTTVRSLTAVLGSSAVGATGPTGIQGATGFTGATGYDFNYSALTTNTNLQTNKGYIVNTTVNGLLTGTLPLSPSVGHFVNFTITSNSSSPFTIARNGSFIDSLAENLVCDINANFTLVYTNPTIGWKFIPFSGLTTPVASVYKAILTASPAVSGLQNIASNQRVPFNQEVFNSNSSIFGGLQNPGNKNTISILVKEPGYYKIDAALHLMDLQEGREIYIQLWQYTDAGGDVLLQTLSDTVIGTAAVTVGIINGSTTIYIPTSNTYLYLVLNHNVPFPGPFTTIIDNFNDTGTKGPSEIILTKIG